jgi:hypothetical protein
MRLTTLATSCPAPRRHLLGLGSARALACIGRRLADRSVSAKIVPGGAPSTTREGACAPRARAGLTILEMLVSTAMLSFIVIGLTAVFIQTSKAFKTAIKQNTITDAGRSIVDMITGDLRQISDAQNTNIYGSVLNNPNYNPNFNFYLAVPSNAVTTFTNQNGAPLYDVELDQIFVLEHTNTTWLGVGYAVSNYPGVHMGALYRYETNWNGLAPVFTNDLFTPYFNNLVNTNFSTNYWHKIADGIIDIKINAFDQNGNTNDYFLPQSGLYYIGYPLYPTFSTYTTTNTLPNSVDLEFGILEPDTLVQARALAGNPTALLSFLSTNTTPHMEIFRQRITIAAASR